MSMLMEGAAPQAPYEWVSVIGTGAYGTVYKARDSSGQTVAIKKIRIASSEEGMPMSMIREVSMLRQLENYEHENIVRLKDVFTAMKNGNELRLMLVFEYVEQDLAQYLEHCPSPGLGPDRIRSLMAQMLTGIDFLHTLRIVHRDLKPQNVLITSTGQLKLADFGLSRIYAFSMALTSVVVTLWYRSPEVLLQETYCTAVDLWSCGCIFAELFNRKPLFSGQSEVDQLCKIFEITGLPGESDWPVNGSIPRSSFSQHYRKQPWGAVVRETDPAARDLLERLLTFDQRKRICASDALRHPYFQDDVIVENSATNVTAQQPAQVTSRLPSQVTSQLFSNTVSQPHVSQFAQPTVPQNANSVATQPTGVSFHPQQHIPHHSSQHISQHPPQLSNNPQQLSHNSQQLSQSSQLSSELSQNSQQSYTSMSCSSFDNASSDTGESIEEEGLTHVTHVPSNHN